MSTTADVFRITHRTDDQLYRTWFIIMLGASVFSALLTMRFATTLWPSILVALFCGTIAGLLLFRIASPKTFEFVVTDHYLHWGVVGGAQTRVYRHELQRVSLASDSEWECMLVRKSPVSDVGVTMSVPGEIIGSSAEQIATELHQRWPESEVYLRGKPLI